MRVRRRGKPFGTQDDPYGWYHGNSGYREDATTFGLMECGARYYDPYTGRFISRDTDLSESPYAYCDGDPVNNTDPSGHSPTDAHDALLAAIAALANGEEVAGFSGDSIDNKPYGTISGTPPSTTIPIFSHTDSSHNTVTGTFDPAKGNLGVGLSGSLGPIKFETSSAFNVGTGASSVGGSMSASYGNFSIGASGSGGNVKYTVGYSSKF